MPVTRLSEMTSTDDFEPQWHVDVRLRGESGLRRVDSLVGPILGWQVSNPKFATIEAVGVTATNGGPVLFDQPRFAEGAPGAVVVPWFRKADATFVVLQEEFRPVVLDPDGHAGAWMWALPRGFGESGESAITTAKRELREETQDRLQVIAAEHVLDPEGRPQGVNPNTTFSPSGAGVIAAQVHPIDREIILQPDPREPVRRLRRVELDGDYSGLSLRCAFTKSALFDFRIWLREKDGRSPS